MRFIDRRSASARYRLRVSRRGPARELTHLGQIESLRRAVQKTDLPVLTDGKRNRPRPKLAFGPAISVGYESAAEYFDMELGAARQPESIAAHLKKALEPGFEIMEVRRIPVFFPSLESSINVVRYEIQGPYPEDAPATLKGFLELKEIVIEKLKEGGARVERVDARPLILRMRLAAPDLLDLTLRFGPKRTVKPEALVRQWLKVGAAREVLVPAKAGGPKAGGHLQAGVPKLIEPLEGFRITRQELLTETSSGELIAP